MPGSDMILEQTNSAEVDATATPSARDAKLDNKPPSLSYTSQEYQEWAGHLKDRVRVFMYAFGNNPGDFALLLQSITQENRTFSIKDKHDCDKDLAELVKFLNELQGICRELISKEQYRKSQLTTLEWYKTKLAGHCEEKVIESFNDSIRKINEVIKADSIILDGILNKIANILEIYHFGLDFTEALNSSKPSPSVLAAHTAISTLGRGVEVATNVASTVISGATTTASFAAHVVGNIVDSALRQPKRSFSSEYNQRPAKRPRKEDNFFAKKVRTHEVLSAVECASSFNEVDGQIFGGLSRMKKPTQASSNPGTGFFAKDSNFLSRLLQWTKEFLHNIHLFQKEHNRKRSSSTSDLHGNIQESSVSEGRKRRHSI